jgi:hypothetical protein
VKNSLFQVSLFFLSKKKNNLKAKITILDLKKINKRIFRIFFKLLIKSEKKKKKLKLKLFKFLFFLFFILYNNNFFIFFNITY